MMYLNVKYFIEKTNLFSCQDIILFVKTEKVVFIKISKFVEIVCFSNNLINNQIIVTQTVTFYIYF